MKEKVQMGCLTGQDQEQVNKPPQSNVDHDFIAFIRLKYGYSADGALDMAYCLGSIHRQWPIDFPNAYSLRQLAMHVLDSDYSKSYQRKCLIAIERYAIYLQIEGVKFKKPRQTQQEINYLTNEEMSKLIHAANTQRDFTILVLFCKTGLRVSELCGLNLEDIDFTRREISINHGKRDKSRKVDFDAQTERVLRTYLGTFKPSPRSPLFVSRNAQRLNRRSVCTMVKKAGERVGLKVHPHMLRHSFATAWISNDADVFHLQSILGHTDISMTRRYFHACKESRRTAYLKGVPQF